MRRLFVLPLGAVVLLAGCGVTSANFPDSAEDVIEDDDRTAENFEGRTFDDAQCEEPPNNEIGTRFNCTATDANGIAVTFVATITEDDAFTISAPQDATGAATTVPDPAATTVPDPTATTLLDPAATTTLAPPTS
ncbi:MAG: hypothetical protein ACR2HP_15000 [Ilumatobacteraceae bacterium]